MTTILLGLALLGAAIATYVAGARMPHGSGMPLYVAATLLAIVGGVLLVVFSFGASFMDRFR